jgi:hypothetical protein
MEIQHTKLYETTWSEIGTGKTITAITYVPGSFSAHPQVFQKSKSHLKI